MASKRMDEETVINIDSAFWMAELYSLTNNAQVTEVNLYLHQGIDAEGKDLWSDPIDLKSKDPVMLERREHIRLSKRGESDLSMPIGKARRMVRQWSKKSLRSVSNLLTQEKNTLPLQ